MRRDRRVALSANQHTAVLEGKIAHLQAKVDDIPQIVKDNMAVQMIEMWPAIVAAFDHWNTALVILLADSHVLS